MISIHEVLSLPGLGLTPIFRPLKTSPDIRWAHVTELVDPSPWLLGNELLLTTGISLAEDPSGWESYCLRLRDAGVAAIGISTGPSLPLSVVPTELVIAAEKHELALIHVPHETLMQTVVQAVSDALHHVQNQDHLRSLSLQRQLSEAASSPDGVQRIVDVLKRSSHYQVVVLDERLHVLAFSDVEAEERVAAFRDQLKMRVREGLRWSISEENFRDRLVVLPLGTDGRLSGVIAVFSPGEITMYARATLGLVASLLGILLERRYASQSHRRTIETRLLERMLADRSAAPEAVAHFRQRSLDIARTYVLSASSSINPSDLSGFVMESLELCEDVILAQLAEETLFLFIGPEEGFAELLRPLVAAAGLGPAGLSEMRGLSSLAESAAQARFVRSVAKSRGDTLLERIDMGGHRALMMLSTAEVRKQFAESVLATIDEADEGGDSALFETLRALVFNQGNHAAAAESLGVHRHTIRSRLEKITRLTGRDLSFPDDFLELWIAVEFRLSVEEDPMGSS